MLLLRGGVKKSGTFVGWCPPISGSPPKLWSKFHFFCGKIFFGLESPDTEKINDQIQKWNFYTLIPPPQPQWSSGISAVAWHLIMHSTTPDIGEHWWSIPTNKFHCVFTRFIGFCIEWKQKQKVVVFGPKVVVGHRTPNFPINHSTKIVSLLSQKGLFIRVI